MRAAQAAFPEWAATTRAQRQEALLSLADALVARAEEFADAECRETGKIRRVVLEEEIPPVRRPDPLLRGRGPAAALRCGR